ncbi:MAG: MFS transporter [Pseudomonadota bacterium]
MIQPIYFFYFMSVGVSMPFFSPYLRGLGLSGRQIATILSIVPVLNMGVPLFWAWTADRTRQHARVLGALCLGAACGYVPLLWARTFGAVLISYLAFAIFSVGIGSLVDSVAIARVRAGGDYGRIRVWGSIGYMASAVGVGALLTARGGRPADRLVPTMVAAALMATFLSTLQLRGTGEPAARPHWNDVRALLGNRRFRLLLVLAPLHWIGCAPYNIFFGIFVRDRHLTPVVLGLALATGVAAEMLVLLRLAQLRRRFEIETLLAVSFAGTIIRWLLMPFAVSTGAVVALQLFHGLTFGLFWGGGIALMTECVPPSLRATGQSLFVTSMLGIGNVVGYLATGWIYDWRGRVDPAFFAAAVLEIVPLTLALMGRRAAARRSG